MVFDRLIYENSARDVIEFTIGGKYHCNLRQDVKGLRSVRTTVYRSPIVNVDGDKETGFHVETRDIDIKGTINARSNDEQDALIQALVEAFSPFQTGTLRFEGAGKVREIDVRPVDSLDPDDYKGKRNPEFSISLLAPDPNWRATAAEEATVSAAGTSLYYDGSKACGLEITITAGADDIDMESLSVLNGDTVETVNFRTAGGVKLSAGAVLKLTTTPRNPSVLLNGVSALERVDLGDTLFPLLYHGNNTLSWSAYGDEAHFTVSVKYTPQYIGL